jgi:hypothetical protein
MAILFSLTIFWGTKTRRGSPSTPWRCLTGISYSSKPNTAEAPRLFWWNLMGMGIWWVIVITCYKYSGKHWDCFFFRIWFKYFFRVSVVFRFCHVLIFYVFLGLGIFRFRVYGFWNMCATKCTGPGSVPYPRRAFQE